MCLQCRRPPFDSCVGKIPGKVIGYLLQYSWACLLAQMVKESDCHAGDLDSIPEVGRFPRGGHGNPLQYSCLENPRGQRSLEGYSPWGHKESETTERLSPHARTTNFQQPFRLIRFAPGRGGVGWSCVSGGSGVEGDAELGVRGVWCHQTELRESVCCRR